MENRNEFDILKHTIEKLSESKLFSCLPSRVIRKIASKVERIYLNKGEILFKQGNPSDALFYVLRGHLSATSTSNNSPITIYRATDTIGEVAFLSQSPHQLTVIAKRRCRLIKIPCELFKELCDKYPELHVNLSKQLAQNINRFFNKLNNRNKSIINAKSILILTNNVEREKNEIVTHLKQLMNSQKIECEYLDNKEFEQFRSIRRTENEIIDWIENIENSNRLTFYFINGALKTVWYDFCIQQIESIFLFINIEDDSPNLSRETLNVLNDPDIINIPREICFIYKTKNIISNKTSEYLKQNNFFRYHHVFMDNEKDIKRLTRFFLDETTGLVLGGGGQKGWAHVGVMKAMFEHNLEVDAIAGVSVGSVMAAIYLQSRDYQDFYDQSQSMLMGSKKALGLTNITYPHTSIYSGSYCDKLLKKLFGSKLIENMKLYYYAVATDLITKQAVILNQGPLWRALRASVAIPCLVPPVTENGYLLVDGSIVDNLPTDLMLKTLGNNAKIIAVDIGDFKIEPKHYTFPTCLSLSQYLSYKFSFKKLETLLPHYTDILTDAVMFGSENKTRENREIADILICPINKKYSFMNCLDAKDELLESGYTSAMKAFEEHASQLSTK